MNKVEQSQLFRRNSMRKAIVSLFVLVIALSSIGTALSFQNEEDAKFQKFLDGYFDALWKFYPTRATLEGFHKYDNKLEDFSSGNIEKHHDALDKFNQELVAKINRSGLSPDLQIDHFMMVDALEKEVLEHENLVSWEYNPLFYNNIFINCIRSLLTKEFAPLETRAKNAVDRLKELPKLIKQAKTSLKTPAQLYTETALKQFPGILDFYKTELPELIQQAPQAHKSNLQSNLAKVIPALEDYQNFLSSELLPRSTGNFRLMEAHARLVRISFQNTIPINELVARAQADYNNLHRDMVLVCMPFYKTMYPEINMEQLSTQRSEEEARNIFIKGVLDKIKGDHVSKGEFSDKVKATVDEVKAFIQANQLIDFPEETLNIEPMPLESQDFRWTHFLSPGAYETDGTYTCQLAPLADDLDDTQIESLLEEYNNFLLPFWTLRRVYPGQFVPLLQTNKTLSLVRKLYPNMPLVMGWPVLIDEMLIYSGLENYDLRLRLNQLKYRLKAVVEFIVEFNVHQGSWTKEQAVAYMTRGGFITEAAAEKKWNSIILNPGDSVYAYVGMQEILDMQKEYKKLKGDAYSDREFFNKLLSHGAIHLRELKKKMME